jgi:uncharacterized protein
MTEVPSRRPPGSPCWASLMAHRADPARSFYGALFGWRFVPGPVQLGNYALATLGGLRVAGIGEGATDPHGPVSWTTMLAADNADEAAELVRECGGTVGIGPLNAGDDGRVAIAVDPSGAVFGIWQGGLLPGADVTGVPGSVAWSELVTRESALVAKFYQAVFGFESAPAEGGGPDRVLLAAGGRPVAGVRGVGGDVPRDRGAHWLTYFAVEDVEEAVGRGLELGGRVVRGLREEGGLRSAVLTDPEGARFALTGPS